MLSSGGGGYGARYHWRVVNVQLVLCSGIQGQWTYTLEVVHEELMVQREFCKDAMVKKSGL